MPPEVPVHSSSAPVLSLRSLPWWPIQALLAVLALALWTPSTAHAQCAVCNACTTDTDCGAGYVCRNLGTAGPRCTQVCTQGSCPGDSVCYSFTSGGTTEMLCLAPGGGCPGGYTCTEDGLSCSGLGTDCSAGANTCSQLEAYICLTATDAGGTTRSYCTCECSTSADCDGQGACQATSGGQTVCQTAANPGMCAGVMCPSGQVCDPGTGNCVSDPNDLCADVMCAPGAICSPATGTCIGGDPDMAADTSPVQDTAGPPADTSPAADTTAPADTAPGTDTSVPPGALLLTMISPTRGLGDRDQLVQVTGQGFAAGMTLRLDVTPLTGVTVASPTFATATVPAGLAPGVYGLHAQLPSGAQYSLMAAYQVNPVDAAPLPSTDASGEGCGCRSLRATSGERTPWHGNLPVVLLTLGAIVFWRRRRR